MAAPIDNEAIATFSNQQIGAAMALQAAAPGQPRPINIRPANPDKFSGNSKKHVEFIFTVENIFNLLGITVEAQKVQFAVSHMTGTALNWWRAVVEAAEQRNLLLPPDLRVPHLEANNWAAFKTLFTSQFQDINATHQARAKLTMLTQKGAARTLVNEMNTLALDIPDISDGELLDKLFSKVKPEIGKLLITMQPQPTTFKEACDAAVRYDDLLYFYSTRGRKNQGPYNPPGNSNGPTPMDLNAIGSSKPTPGATLDPKNGRDPRSLPKFDPIKGPRCFKCNNYGHMASECRQSHASGSQRSKN